MKKNLRAPGQVKRQRRSRLSPARVVASLAMFVLLVGVWTMVSSQSAQQGKGGKKYVATEEIVLDKASGKLRKPTAEETQVMVDQVSAFTNRSSDGLTVTTHPNGMKTMNAEGRFSGVVLGRANADGTTEIRCVFSMEEAAEFLGLEEVNQ